MNEAQYQTRLMKKVQRMIPGAFIIRNDPRYVQGLPDILVLHKKRWGMLEVKLSDGAPRQPNQEFYVDLLNDMSFASFICPENEEDVLDDLQRSLGVNREARVS